MEMNRLIVLYKSLILNIVWISANPLFMVLLQNRFDEGVSAPLCSLEILPLLPIIQVQLVLAAHCVEEHLQLGCEGWLEVLDQVPSKVKRESAFKSAVSQLIVPEFVV